MLEEDVVPEVEKVEESGVVTEPADGELETLPKATVLADDAGSELDHAFED